MNFYPIYRNKKLLPWIKWWLIKGNKVTPKHLSEWINSAEAITLTGVYKGSPLLNLNLNGNTSQTGTPTPEAPVPVNVVKGNNTITINDTSYQVNLKSKNLIANNIETQEINGLTITKGDDGSLLINGTTNNTTRLNLMENFLIKNGSYVWSTNASGTVSNNCYLSLIKTGTTTEVSGSAINLKSATIKAITISETTNTYVRFYTSSGITFTNFKIYPMLEEGSQSTTYEPYYDYELCKIGTYQDVIYKESNKWYVAKYIGKTLFTGSENWQYAAALNAFYLPDFIGQITNTDIAIYSNKYKAVSRETYNSSDYTIYGNNVHVLSIRDVDYTSASSFKTYLSTANVYAYYPLAESTTTEITETNLVNQLEAIYNAKLQSGTNEITQTPSDLPFYLNFQYYEKG